MSLYRERPGGVRVEQLEASHAYLAREHRIINLRGPVFGAPHRWDDFSVTALVDAIMVYNIEDTEKPIYLVINSEGGAMGDGFVLYDTIKASIAPVVTVVQQAASMATVIFAAGSRRLVYPNARLMLHLPFLNGVAGDTRDIEITAKEMNARRDMIIDAYLSAGVDRNRKQILRDIDRPHWMSAQESVDYGLASGFVEQAEMLGGKEPA